jgi:hypothetical protein
MTKTILAVVVLAAMLSGCAMPTQADPEDAVPRRNGVDDVAQDLAKVLSDLDERKRKLGLLETLIMERDLKRRRLSALNEVRPGDSATVLKAMPPPLRRSVVERQDEPPMSVYEYPGVEIYIRKGTVVAVKRYAESTSL